MRGTPAGHQDPVGPSIRTQPTHFPFGSLTEPPSCRPLTLRGGQAPAAGSSSLGVDSLRTLNCNNFGKGSCPLPYDLTLAAGVDQSLLCLEAVVGCRGCSHRCAASRVTLARGPAARVPTPGGQECPRQVASSNAATIRQKRCDARPCPFRRPRLPDPRNRSSASNPLRRDAQSGQWLTNAARPGSVRTPGVRRRVPYHHRVNAAEPQPAR